MLILLWKPGHVPPRFAIEVVSETYPAKDYVDAPAKFARLGTRELVVFDPTLIGPGARGGPYVLQVWRRDEERSRMVRVHAGAGPAFSEELGAWLIATSEPRLRIANDPEGASLWLTDAEAQSTARVQAEQQALASVRAAIEDLCDLCGITLDAGKRAHLESLGVAELDDLRRSIVKKRGWV